MEEPCLLREAKIARAGPEMRALYKENALLAGGGPIPIQAFSDEEVRLCKSP